MMESKIEKKRFGIAEFKLEEKWLEEQHKNGWRLVKTNGTKYQFESCDAGKWIYQLDFKENGPVEEEYIRMFKDCGWEYVLQYGKWCYFRRKEEDGIDLSIFSDRFSKIDMYGRLTKSRQLTVAIALFAAACVIVCMSIFTTAFSGDSFLDGAMPWIGIGLFVACSFSIDQYIKLRKMAEELKSPED